MTVLEFQAASIAIDSIVVTDELSFRTAANRVALIGDWHAFHRYLLGRAELVAGRIVVAGQPALDALQTGRLALLFQAMPVPRGWTVARWLTLSCALTGATQRDAQRRALEVLARLEATPLATAKMHHLNAAQRIQVLCAGVLTTDPSVVLVDDILAGFDEVSRDRLAPIVAETIADRSVLLSAEGIPSAGALRDDVERCEELIVLEGGRLTLHGSPDAVFGSGPRYRVVVEAGWPPLHELWVARGVVVHGSGSESALLDGVIEVPAGVSVRDLLVDADRCAAVVSQVVPVVAPSADELHAVQDL